MRQVVDEIIAQMSRQVERWAEQAEAVMNVEAAEALEQRVQADGQRLLGESFERLLQRTVDAQSESARSCPHCGQRRRHKGRQRRGLISRLGPVQLHGVYWYCPTCREGGQTLDRFTAGTVSGLMKELWTYLSVSCSSFEKAAQASERLLGVGVDPTTLRALCLREGRRVMRERPTPAKVDPGQDVTASCDGMMVHSREEGWREMRAFRYDYGEQTHGGASLCSAAQFAPKLRRAAIDIGVGRARRLFFPADAAAWIDRAVQINLPDAIRIIDIYHAWQHIHEAARAIWGEGTPRALQWARQRCEELQLDGGRKLWDRLRRARFKKPAQQQALNELVNYLQRHAEHMDYPAYVRQGWPIGSGAMESFCKQLGRRLKGPGMRWSLINIDPMATLVSLYNCDQWQQAFPKAA
jgi:hypothetical protein